VSDSPHDHEREALAFLRRRLPDRDPYHVWSNFEFVAPNGNLYEIDALVLSDNGLHLVEIKSYPGAIAGDGATWQWTTPEGRLRQFDNPRLLANRKAKALKEVLSRTRTFGRRPAELPYVAEVVFLSDPRLEVGFTRPGRHQVFGRDAEPGQEIPRERAAIGGIVEELTSLTPTATGRSRRRIDRPLGVRVVKAVGEAGIRERTGRRQVGDYDVVELLDDVEADRDTGVAYQDFLVRHRGVKGLERRWRVYPLELNATTARREAAERAARREFEHLHPLRHHQGIVAPAEPVSHERGPGLLFDHDPDEERLDRWLTAPGVRDHLTVGDRLEIVRQLVEALAHAHGNGVYHRAVGPSAVYVHERDGRRVVRLANWHAGARLGTGDASTSMTATSHLEALSGGDAELYRAPEHNQERAAPAAMDVFSLGCLACYVFTGAPPAATPAKLFELLSTSGAVIAEASGDAVDESVSVLIATLTDVDPAARPDDMAEVLALLDEIEAEWTRPEVDEPHVTEARQAATLLSGRFDVRARIGMGSTAFALLVRDRDADERLGVLKVARSPDLNDRVVAEAGVLAKVHHPGIVELLGGPLEIDGHAAILLSYAGPKADADRHADPAADEGKTRDQGPRTLAARIGEPFGAELLERFGEDLLDSVRHLEQMGVAHRDIKPQNLGLGPRGRNEELHLVLFDFSLAAVPVDRIDAGTPGYLDPFLRRPGRGVWDLAAERYAAAVVLFEMCTGTKPVYGDGTADPVLVDALPNVDSALFDPSIADGLTSFFDRALAPDAGQRYGTAADMLWAWREAFRPASQPAGGRQRSPNPAADFMVPPGTTRGTPLAGLPLSNRAVNATEREDVLTVGDLLAVPANRLRQLRGVGALTRRELTTAVARLQLALADAGDLPDDAPVVEAARLLVPRPTRGETSRVETIHRFLGLDGDAPTWPTQAELARSLGISRQRVSQILVSARSRWEKQPQVTALRTWVAAELDAVGGVASLSQLADRLLRSRPGNGDDDERHRAAVALVRVALLVEAERTSPRWAHRLMGDDAVAVARSAVDGPEANALLDYADALARRTTDLVGDRSVVARTELVEALSAQEAPAGLAPLADAHLAELAASLCGSAAVNSRLELYRRGLPAWEALAAARRAFVATTGVTPERVAEKVRARFPESEPLPCRPQLDALLADIGVELGFDEDSGEYRPPELPSAVSSSASLSRYGTALPAPRFTPVEVDTAQDFEARLLGSLDHGGLFVLVTDQGRLEAAADELARLPVTVVDVDEWLVGEMERLTAGGTPSWDVVVSADAAGPGSAVWQNLARMVDRAAGAFTDRLMSTPGAVLLTRCGLLARYDRLDLVARWRGLLHDRVGALTALWMLVATAGASDVPLLDGKAVPVLSRNEWARIPDDWLRNVHRAGAAR
jgi:serine/threonine protein kinase